MPQTIDLADHQMVALTRASLAALRGKRFGVTSIGGTVWMGDLMFMSAEAYNGRVDCKPGSGNPSGPDSVSKERMRGVRVFDIHGKEYIEGMSGLWCIGLGYGQERLVAPIGSPARHRRPRSPSPRRRYSHRRRPRP